MRFYFPDSQDQVSPTYDFLREEYSPFRVRQRDDLYAHELLDPVPYDGLLVSKAIVDGSARGSAKYSERQRARLYRLGVARFFRLPPGMVTLGDCGAFNYVDEDVPPYTVDEVLDFYNGCGFDAGVSVDHVVLGYAPDIADADAPSEWRQRQEITLRLSADFLERAHARHLQMTPVGAAQGWSPSSYAHAVAVLQEQGYQRIALGGMVALKTRDILACLQEIASVREPTTALHLLGITRLGDVPLFGELGVTSLDSTSPFRQSFMDAHDNYYADGGAYTAIRVPQSDGNPKLKRDILAGRVSQEAALAAERRALAALRAYAARDMPLGDVLTALSEHMTITGAKPSYLDEYSRTLADRPWEHCTCAVCAESGIEVVIFRGTERNKRRGFHNLSVTSRGLRSLPTRRSA